MLFSLIEPVRRRSICCEVFISRQFVFHHSSKISAERLNNNRSAFFHTYQNLSKSLPQIHPQPADDALFQPRDVRLRDAD